VFNFYQINENCEIQTRDYLMIKAMILYQKTISTQKFKLLGEFSGYDLYYYLTVSLLNYYFYSFFYFIFNLNKLCNTNEGESSWICI
jgi:hypothetical protein